MLRFPHGTLLCRNVVSRGCKHCTLTSGAFPEDGDNGWVGPWRRFHVVSEAQRATRPERKAITQDCRQKHELCNVFRRVSVLGGKAPLGVTTQSNEANV